MPRIVEALVSALDHESPFCVAAAAGALASVGNYKEVGPVLIKESSAIPALIGVLKRRIPPGNLEQQTAIFRQYALHIEACVHLGM
jgi:hypothetical protein